MTETAPIKKADAAAIKDLLHDRQRPQCLSSRECKAGSTVIGPLTMPAACYFFFAALLLIVSRKKFLVQVRQPTSRVHVSACEHM